MWDGSGEEDNKEQDRSGKENEREREVAVFCGDVVYEVVVVIHLWTR